MSLMSRVYSPERRSLALLWTLSLPLLMPPLSGCGGAAERSSSERRACAEARRGHPSDRYLTATGGGATPAEATKAAMAELSSQISAQLSSELTISASESSAGDADQQVTQDLKVSSAFAHAELIKPIEACARCEDQGCEALVALDRDEAAARVIKELGPDAERLTTALASLTAQASLLDFTPAWHAARGAYERLRPQLNQLEVIGRLPRKLAHVHASMKRAQELKATRIQELSVLIKPLKVTHDSGAALQEQARAPLEAALRGRLSSALEQVGLKVWGQEACPEPPGPEVLVLEPRGLLSCTLGYVGPQCALSLSVELGACASGVEPTFKSLSAAEWSSLKLVGVHPQDQAEALRRLVTSISRKELTPHVARSLSPFVPF